MGLNSPFEKLRYILRKKKNQIDNRMAHVRRPKEYALPVIFVFYAKLESNIDSIRELFRKQINSFVKKTKSSSLRDCEIYVDVSILNIKANSIELETYSDSSPRSKSLENSSKIVGLINSLNQTAYNKHSKAGKKVLDPIIVFLTDSVSFYERINDPVSGLNNYKLKIWLFYNPRSKFNYYNNLIIPNADKYDDLERRFQRIIKTLLKIKGKWEYFSDLSLQLFNKLYTIEVDKDYKKRQLEANRRKSAERGLENRQEKPKVPELKTVEKDGGLIEVEDCEGIYFVPDDITEIGCECFKGHQLTGIVFSEDSHLKLIGKNAFAGCPNLAFAVLPGSLEELGEGAFSGCGMLTDVVFSDSKEGRLKVIGAEAFQNCGSLEQATLPDSVREIGEHAFDGCEKLSALSLPRKLERIADGLCKGCSSLKRVALCAALQHIGSEAFFGCLSLKNLMLSENVKSIGMRAFLDCRSLNYLSFSDKLSEIKGGAFIGCKSLADLKLPASLRRIGEFAFDDCVGLTATLPESLEQVGKNAFRNVKRVNYSGPLSSSDWGMKEISGPVQAGSSSAGPPDDKDKTEALPSVHSGGLVTNRYIGKDAEDN